MIDDEAATRAAVLVRMGQAAWESGGALVSISAAIEAEIQWRADEDGDQVAAAGQVIHDQLVLATGLIRVARALDPSLSIDTILTTAATLVRR